MELIKLLNWRYATKRMTGKRIPQEQLDNILEAIRLSASSIGLQPYQIFVVSDQATREKLRQVANQPQVMESSHLLIFAAYDQVTQKHVDDFIALTASERNITTESLAPLRTSLENVMRRPPEQGFAWAARQAYIALGTGLIAAANEGVDATPMEGFSNEGVDEVLGLKQKGLKSVCFLALGYRNEPEDWLAPLKKVRKAKEDLFVFI